MLGFNCFRNDIGIYFVNIKNSTFVTLLVGSFFSVGMSQCKQNSKSFDMQDIECQSSLPLDTIENPLKYLVYDEKLYWNEKHKADSIHAINVEKLSDSEDLKTFLMSEEKSKNSFLNSHPDYETAMVFCLRLNKYFPSLDLSWLKRKLCDDKSWIETKMCGYKQIDSNDTTKMSGFVPDYKPAWLNCHGFFENDIKQDERGKYLVFKYYGKRND